MATITKEFTINVPDTWWVDSWNDGNTQTYTYEGPDTLWVEVGLKDDFSIISYSDTEIVRNAPEDEDRVDVIQIDANTQPECAHLLWMSDDDWEYTYTTVTNHDGSTHEEMDNPKMSDLFEIKWTPADGFTTDPIYKETQTEAERIAKERRDYIKKYDDAYDFDDATQASIDTALAAFATYLTTMETAYPWRYVTIDKAEIPRVPAALITVFNDLPALD